MQQILELKSDVLAFLFCFVQDCLRQQPRLFADRFRLLVWQFRMMVQGVAVSANVTIKMFKGSNQCTATVTPNYNGNRISFVGNLYPTEASNVFKGRSI